MPTDMQAVKEAVETFEKQVEDLVGRCQAAGAYMPALATRLRLYGDELADRFPDETNQS